jgi:hypothetical protein
VTIAASVKPGVRSSPRHAYRRSWKKLSSIRDSCQGQPVVGRRSW